jgi:hypothetical protein
MLSIPILILTLANNDHTDPAQYDQQNWNETVVDKEAGLSCPLEAPIHRVRTKKPTGGLLLRITNLILNRGFKEILGLVGDRFIGGHVEEDEDPPKSDALVEILRLYLVRKH